MKILRKTISLAVVATFVVTSCVQAAPITISRDTLRPASLKNTIAREDVSESLNITKTNPAQEPEPGSDAYAEKWATKFGLKGDEKEYFIFIYRKYLEYLLEYLDEKVKPLKIGENFIPSAMMTDDKERKDKLGVIEYSDLVRQEKEEEARYADVARKKVIITMNPLDGGLGKAAGRTKYLDTRAEIAIGRKGRAADPDIIERAKYRDAKGNIPLGAKGIDFVFDVLYEGRFSRLSIAEVKLIRLLTEILKYKSVRYQPLISDESLPSYMALLHNKASLFDNTKKYNDYLLQKRILPGNNKKTFKEAMDMFNTRALPTAKPDTRELQDKKAPGGHGQLGMMFLLDALKWQDPEDSNIYIRAFFNGDGVNNMPDEIITGWMAKTGVPIVMITTTKTGIDRKGGQLGVQKIKDEKTGEIYERVQILELAQVVGKKQMDMFSDMGLPNSEYPGTQYFNTNVALINYNELHKILQKLREILAQEDEEGSSEKAEEKIKRFITPTLIVNEAKKEQGYIQLDSALGSALLNLTAFFNAPELHLKNAKNAQKVKKILSDRGISHLLRMVNASTLQERTKFFTPFKDSFDFWFQNFSNYYNRDFTQQDWMLAIPEEQKQTPPIVNLKAIDENGDNYYDEVQHLINSFGTNAYVKELNSLFIRGIVKLPDNSQLKGNVVIINEGTDTVDFSDKEIQQKLTDKGFPSKTTEGGLVFDNVMIIIRADNKAISVAELKPGEDIKLVILGEKMLLFGVASSLVGELMEKLERRDIKIKNEDLDVLNDKGEIMGRLDTVLVHETRLIHQTANAFVMTPDGKFLLRRKSHTTPEEPLSLSIYGGHLITQQTHESTITEKLKDTLALEFLNGNLYRLGEGPVVYRDKDNKNNEMRLIYIYVPSKKETTWLQKEAEIRKDMKSKKTRKEYEKLLEEERNTPKARRKRKQSYTGWGRVYSSILVDYETLSSALQDEKGRYLPIPESFKDVTEIEKAVLSPSLLGPLLDELNVQGVIRDLIKLGPQETLRKNPAYITHRWELLLKKNMLSSGLFSKEEVNNPDSRILAAYMSLLIDRGVTVPEYLSDLIMKHYGMEQEGVVLIKNVEYGIKADNTKYDNTGKPLPFDGITTLVNLPPEHAVTKLVRNVIENLNSWQGNNLAEPILATTPFDSEHITVYDAVCENDWEDKYNIQFNKNTKDEIERLVKQGTDRKLVVYRVITERISKALSKFKTDRLPTFKPIGVSAFPSHFADKDKVQLVLSIAPVSAEDLAALTKMQEAIRETTGITNFGIFNGHITLGYFINPIKDEQLLNKFHNYIAYLDAYIKSEVRKDEISRTKQYHFELPSIELSYFKDMSSFPSLTSFSWTDATKNREAAKTVDINKISLTKPTVERAKSANDMKSSSAGMLNLEDVGSLNTQVLKEAIASVRGDLAEILVKSKFVGELFKVEAAGTIVIDDESLPFNQRGVISDIYDANSEALKELERLTGCVIRLHSQLTKDEIKGQLIIISDKNKIPGYEDAKYLNIKNNIPKAADSYLPLVPLIGIAKVLLTSDDIEYIRTTLNKDDFYRDIFGHPVTKQEIQSFLDTGIFELPVPKFDYEKVEQLQRQALAALIAA